MARHESLPDSPLSSLGSDDHASDSDDARTIPEDREDDNVDDVRPTKRQKTNGGGALPAAAAMASLDSGDVAPDARDPLEDLSDVSSDTSSDIPSSPIHTRPEEDDFQEQVSFCTWEGCDAGELHNMDRLVEHIYNEHIEGRYKGYKKYTCEWQGCPRKSIPHASGYALKAHMRGHTREKPFYCQLPECDRSFTRSDALGKHMRTIHEAEAIRPLELANKMAPPDSATTNPVRGKSNRQLKIIIKTPQSVAPDADDPLVAGATSADSSGSGGGSGSGSHPSDGTSLASVGGCRGSDEFTPLLPAQGFSARELAMPLDKLYAVCRCQVEWAQRENEELRRECQAWEELYKQEWLEKEVLLDQVVQAEMGYHERRKAVLAAVADGQAPMTMEGKDGSVNGLGSPPGSSFVAVNAE